MKRYFSYYIDFIIYYKIQLIIGLIILLAVGGFFLLKPNSNNNVNNKQVTKSPTSEEKKQFEQIIKTVNNYAKYCSDHNGVKTVINENKKTYVICNDKKKIIINK